MPPKRSNLGDRKNAVPFWMEREFEWRIDGFISTDQTHILAVEDTVWKAIESLEPSDKPYYLQCNSMFADDKYYYDVTEISMSEESNTSAYIKKDSDSFNIFVLPKTGKDKSKIPIEGIVIYIKNAQNFKIDGGTRGIVNLPLQAIFSVLLMVSFFVVLAVIHQRFINNSVRARTLSFQENINIEAGTYQASSPLIFYMASQLIDPDSSEGQKSRLRQIQYVNQ